MHAVKKSCAPQFELNAKMIPYLQQFAVVVELGDRSFVKRLLPTLRLWGHTGDIFMVQNLPVAIIRAPLLALAASIRLLKPRVLSKSSKPPKLSLSTSVAST
jgi:hypothetical protein